MKKSLLALCALFIFAGCSVSPKEDSSSSALSALNEALADLGLDTSKVTIYEHTGSGKITEAGNNFTCTWTFLIALENDGDKFVRTTVNYQNGTGNLNWDDKIYTADNKLYSSASYTGTYSKDDAPEGYTYLAHTTYAESKMWNYEDEKYDEGTWNPDSYYALKDSGNTLILSYAEKESDGSWRVSEYNEEYTKQ